MIDLIGWKEGESSMLEFKFKSESGIKQVKNINDKRFDALFVSFSLDSPDALLENKVNFKKSGYVVVDNGYQSGNYENRFWLFKIINGKLVNERAHYISLNLENKLKINRFLFKYLKKLKYSGYNDDDLNQIKLSVA